MTTPGNRVPGGGGSTPLPPRPWWASLRVSVPLIIGLFGLAGTLVITEFDSLADRANLTAEYLRELERDVTVMQSEIEHETLLGNMPTVQRLITLENQHLESVAALLLDDSRTVIAANRAEWVGLSIGQLLSQVPPLENAGLAPRIAAMRRSPRSHAYAEPGTPWIVACFTAQLPPSPGGRQQAGRSGVLVVVRDLSWPLSRVASQARREAAVQALVMAFLAAGMALFFHVRVTRRLHVMTEAMTAFATGNLSHRLAVGNRRDEVDDAYRGLNQMMDTVLAGIRARERAEHSLRISEERFRLTFEEAGTGLALVDGSGTIIKVNKAFARFLGYEAAELVGQLLSRFEFEDLSGSESLLMLDLRARRLESAHMERRFRAKDGRVLWAELSITTLGDIQDAQTLILQVQDVTARREAQRSLDEAMELNQKIIDSASPGIFAFRQTGTCIFANESAGRIFGGTATSMLGRDFRRWSPWRESGLAAAAETVLAHGGIQKLTVQVPLEGRRVELDCVINAFPRGGETHLLVLADDATGRRQAEAALVGAARQATIGQLSAGVAHEFNNILAILRAQLQVLSDRTTMAADPEVTSILATLSAQISRGSNIVRSLMTLARPHPLQKAPLAVADVLAEVMALQRRQLAVDGIAVTLDAEPDLVVDADSTQLQQVLINLILNARDAMKGRKEGGVLKVRAAKREHTVVFELEDNGIGMDQETLSRATDPFFTTRGREGTGLGLPMCQRIISGHGGELRLRSRPGEGTTVTFTLPASRAGTVPEIRALDPPAEIPAEPEMGEPETPARLLVVDDEEALASGLASFLRQRGFVVDCCTDHKSAMRAIDIHEYALAVIDQTIPGTSGTELAAHLKRRNPGISIFLMTGLLDREALSVAAHAAGITAILQKPFELNELLGRVRAAVVKK